MHTLRKVLWTAAAILLVLCLRVNSNRSVEGALTCIDPKTVEAISRLGCEEDRSWTVSLKFPWRRW